MREETAPGVLKNRGSLRPPSSCRFVSAPLKQQGEQQLRLQVLNDLDMEGKDD